VLPKRISGAGATLCRLPGLIQICICQVNGATTNDRKGHEIVAAIAETHLTDTARKRIKELLPQGTSVSRSIDVAGQSRQIPDMDSYHFINFPKDANAYDHQRDCKLRNCIIEAIAWYLQVLKSPDAPRNEKRTALRFIARLVGDIHQPLHAGFSEDRGGNSVDVRFNRQERKPAFVVGHGSGRVRARHSGRDRDTNPSCPE
jgi:S1/P1 Nuclease